MKILGIETSCDETSAAVVEQEIVHSNVVQGQLELHAAYGGVVPELASRAHITHISAVVAAALRQANCEARALDGIAVTVGPGLIGGLLVGLTVAKGMAIAMAKPLIGIHHMEGHLMSPFLRAAHEPMPGCNFPFVALLVSGGHTLLLYAQRFGHYQLLGQTRDDAAGEAFDKGARMLGLPYPGGPSIAALAMGGDPTAIRFPRAWLDRNRFDFSFSGLKTSLRTHLLNHPLETTPPQAQRDLAASYQEALVDILASKALAACRKVGSQRLLVAGGVGANQRLRTLLQQRAERIQLLVPPLPLCTDNGAMIALAGLHRLTLGQQSDWSLNVRPRWPIAELNDHSS
ncbi:MAG: tRNA (adenosine(37)-N6)-threonylcarbamoyltransferase complex transferase subunit TsaD [Magnetococcales bacterium]|nr:tRNA (adenosine(37)-N6)-threonylcarbamoyltransferase complex transferase subunit TsaD [Magnetococcales bacterium]